jgi:excinuclease ABC subunit A
LNQLSLHVRYKEKNFGEILKMSLQEAKTFLPPITKIHKILQVLEEVGLDYLHLGQEISSLSGGEAQRLRLARELIKRSTGKTLYLFDEPTIGLHFEDIKKLIAIFRKLTIKGNTVIIIEHNLDILAQADRIIDLGPLGGKKGGELVAQASPEKLINEPKSLTGKYLKEHFNAFYYKDKA